MTSTESKQIHYRGKIRQNNSENVPAKNQLRPKEWWYLMNYFTRWTSVKTRWRKFFTLRVGYLFQNSFPLRNVWKHEGTLISKNFERSSLFSKWDTSFENTCWFDKNLFIIKFITSVFNFQKDFRTLKLPKIVQETLKTFLARKKHQSNHIILKQNYKTTLRPSVNEYSCK